MLPNFRKYFAIIKYQVAGLKDEYMMSWNRTRDHVGAS
jgi:hypothetical protein